MSRLRVLMTADTLGGVWSYACELAAGLDELGVDITLATMGRPPTATQRRAIAALPNVDLVASAYALEWMPDPWADVDAAGDWLLQIADLVRPDVVHVNGFAHAALPFAAPVVSVVHSCVCSWFRAVRGADAPAEWDPYRRRVAAGLRAARAVIAPTRAIANEVAAAHGITLDARVIANGCDPEKWQPRDKERFVLAAGRLWDEAKGLAELDACAARIAWPIHVAGSTYGPSGAAPSARGVRPLGVLRPDALADWMGRASIYALPARYEPFGLSIVEAALAGATLVVGKLASLEELWADTAVYVPPGDPDALAAALAALIADPLRRRALAAAARNRALALTTRRMAAAYHELYTELLSDRAEEVA